MKVHLLDCTLRDGGYVNNWMFGSENIEKIIKSLICAGMDFIECGFLKKCGISGSSLFDGVCTGINPLISYIDAYPKQNFTLMYNTGEIDIEVFLKDKIPQNLFIRMAFRKNQLEQALYEAGLLVDCGIKVFINPMFTNTYSPDERYNLIKAVNILKPFAVCITDTSGSMTKKDTLRLVKYFDKNLGAGILIDFHSHNNLNLSLTNSLAIVKQKLNHDLILDCCISGMGRGAGNLSTEEIIKKIGQKSYLQINMNGRKIIADIYKKTPWGVSYALYQSAKSLCHPDYALYIENTAVKQQQYKRILTSIPESFKYKFNKLEIEKIIRI